MKNRLGTKRALRRFRRSDTLGAVVTFGATTYILNHFACSQDMIQRADRVVIYRHNDRLKTAIAKFKGGFPVG